MEQLNESKNAFLPPEVSTDLKSSMRQPPRQTHQVQRPNMRVAPNQNVQRGLPPESMSTGIDPEAISLLNQHIKVEERQKVSPTQVVLGLGLVGGLSYMMYNKFIKEQS